MKEKEDGIQTPLAFPKEMRRKEKAAERRGGRSSSPRKWEKEMQKQVEQVREGKMCWSE